MTSKPASQLHLLVSLCLPLIFSYLPSGSLKRRPTESQEEERGNTPGAGIPPPTPIVLPINRPPPFCLDSKPGGLDLPPFPHSHHILMSRLPALINVQVTFQGLRRQEHSPHRREVSSFHSVPDSFPCFTCMTDPRAQRPHKPATHGGKKEPLAKLSRHSSFLLWVSPNQINIY